jgi:hypothetical protein
VVTTARGGWETLRTKLIVCWVCRVQYLSNCCNDAIKMKRIILCLGALCLTGCPSVKLNKVQAAHNAFDKGQVVRPAPPAQESSNVKPTITAAARGD